MSVLPGALLPAVSFPSAPAGTPVGLRSGRGPRVLLLVHSADCEECRGYASGDFAATTDGVGEWGGRLTVVVPGGLDGASDFATGIPDGSQVLADPERRLASGQAALVIADEWGEVCSVADAGTGHRFPTPPEIIEWVRFLAIQCPECEGPEGEWKTVW